MYQWMTTTLNPRARFNAGPTGWKLHCVELGEYRYITLRGVEIDRSKALCGLRARHGWGGDLFVEDCCERCSEIAFKRGLQPPADADGKPAEWDPHYMKPTRLKAAPRLNHK